MKRHYSIALGYLFSRDGLLRQRYAFERKLLGIF